MITRIPAARQVAKASATCSRTGSLNATRPSSCNPASSSRRFAPPARAVEPPATAMTRIPSSAKDVCAAIAASRPRRRRVTCRTTPSIEPFAATWVVMPSSHTCVRYLSTGSNGQSATKRPRCNASTSIPAARACSTIATSSGSNGSGSQASTAACSTSSTSTPGDRPRGGDRQSAQREGARLVRADDGGRAERLDTREPPNQRVRLRQSPRTQREVQRVHHRELFRDRGDGQADAGDDRLPPPVPVEELGEHDRRTEHRGDDRERAHESSEAPLQWRRRRSDGCHQRADAPVLRGRPREREPHQGAAGQHGRAGEHRITDLLGDRQRFTGERGFIGEELRQFQDLTVGGNDVALAQPDQVPDDERLGGHLGDDTIAHGAARSAR